MRIIVLGNLNGDMATAVAVANRDGGRFVHADSLAAATKVMRSEGAELLLIEVGMDTK